MFRQNYAEVDEAYETCIKVLLDTPAIGTPISAAPDYRIYVTERVNDTPAFNIMYTFDIEHLYLCSITKFDF